MAHRVCPWWIGYVLVSPLRRLIHDPATILAPYVREGMTVLEPGPGMGFFTLEVARRVGTSGRVIAVDVQPKMLEGLQRRAERRGLLPRIDARLAAPNSLEIQDVAGRVDLALALAVVHEVEAPQRFFIEVAQALKPGARLLLAEPRSHVKRVDFDAELHSAVQAGLRVTEQPAIRRTRAVVLEKPKSG